MTRILITGGLGLIGSEIAEQALAGGHHVTIVDDGRASVVPYVEGALHVGQAIEDFGGTEPVDCIVHCAAPVGPVGILGRDVMVEMIDATRAACGLAEMLGTRLIVLSSSEVYGTTTPTGHLTVPDDWSHRTEYGVGKIVTEQLARRHYAQTGYPTAVIRPWNVTGPRQSASKGFVFPRFAEQVVAGGLPTVYLPGTQSRAFMAVEDFAALTLGLLDGDKHWDARPIDAATPDNEISLIGLAARFGGGHFVTVDPTDEHGPDFREADSGSKLPPANPALIGWTGLDEMIDAAMAATRERIALAA